MIIMKVKCLLMEDINASKYINDELRNAVFCDMPNYTDQLMKATYIYIKLCKLLSYDEQFYAANQKGPIAEYHENITHLHEITPTNNNVVCYEFAVIYKTFLNEVGINAVITRDDDLDNVYGKGHTYVKFMIKDEIYNADSTQSVFTGDLFAAKLNLPINGIYTDDRDSDLTYYASKVYCDIKLPVVDNAKNDPDYLNSNLSLYQNLTINRKEIPLKERLDTIINKAQSSPLKGFDCIVYLNYLLHFLIPVKDKFNIKMTFIRDNTKDIITARAIIQLYVDDLGEFEYYSYGSDHELKPITLEEIQTMFDNHELEYIKEDKDHTIQGVKVR